METIQGVLAKNAATPDYVLRRDRVGDLGHIASRQGLIYEQEYGWDKTYEAMVAKILTEFVGRNDAVNERAWIAESQGAILGSVYLMKEDARLAAAPGDAVDAQPRSEVLVIDGITLWGFDFIDLGRIRMPSHTVPVTIKSLVFSEDPRSHGKSSAHVAQ